MKKKSIIALIVVLLIIGGGIFLYNKTKSTTKDELVKNEFKLTTTKDEYVAKNDEGTIIAKNKITNVSITNESKKEQATKIEESINEIMKDYWDKANEKADELLESGFYDATLEDLNFGVMISASEYYMSDNNYIIEVMEVGAFGGSEWNAKYLYNYNPNTGELISLKDIANSYQTLQTTVIKHVKDYLNKKYKKDELFISDKKDKEIFDIIQQDGNWALTNEGLVIIFQKNDIAPSSTGIIEVNIEMKEIENILNKNYK